MIKNNTVKIEKYNKFLYEITEDMKLAAAYAIAGLVPEDQLNEDNIMPEAFNPQVAEVVANAVKSHIR